MKITSPEARSLAFKHGIAALGAYEALASWTGKAPTVTRLLRGDGTAHDGWKCMSWPKRIAAGALTALIGAHLFLGVPRGRKPGGLE